MFACMHSHASPHYDGLPLNIALNPHPTRSALDLCPPGRQRAGHRRRGRGAGGLPTLLGHAPHLLAQLPRQVGWQEWLLKRVGRMGGREKCEAGTDKIGRTAPVPMLCHAALTRTHTPAPPCSWYRWLCRYVYVPCGGGASALVATLAISTVLHGATRQVHSVECS